MNYFIQNIHINKLLHLQDFDIEIPEKSPHLIITGKNGSGKTVLLKAIVEVLDNIMNHPHSILFSNSLLEHWKQDRVGCPENSPNLNEQSQGDLDLLFDLLFRNLDIRFSDIAQIISLYQKKDFIISFYGAARLTQMKESVNPTKPNLHISQNASDALTDQFLYFLSDLKVQEALARNERQDADADRIQNWFENFENLLKEIYQDQTLELIFNYKNYSFVIKTNGKAFKFTQMSDGFTAAIDIIADLILKMQDGDSVTYDYLKPGIVLIDEIETHLHLELQRLVLPMLTRLFPNIQFIVTTHSPFVLNSLETAVAYDLEHREVINELTEYSYESLAEGYFGVKTDSSYVEMRLRSLKALLEKNALTNVEKEQLLSLMADFEKIPEAVSPTAVGEFQRLKVAYSDRINALN